MKKKKPLRSWTLWVFKATSQYFEPCEIPRLGGMPTCKDDFEWVEVREIRKKRKPGRRANSVERPAMHRQLHVCAGKHAGWARNLAPGEKCFECGYVAEQEDKS